MEEKLINEIEDLKFNAWKRREWHDDPVGAEDLEEQAKRKEEELLKLRQAEEVKNDILASEWK